jgi:hypothetical protein
LEALGLESELHDLRKPPGAVGGLEVGKAHTAVEAQLLASSQGPALGSPIPLDPDFHSRPVNGALPAIDPMTEAWEHHCVLGRQDFLSNFLLVIDETRTPQPGRFALMSGAGLLP